MLWCLVLLSYGNPLVAVLCEGTSQARPPYERVVSLPCDGVLDSAPCGGSDTYQRTESRTGSVTEQLRGIVASDSGFM